MSAANKVQLKTDRMPRSFYISKEEYAGIYPEERVLRRLPVTFNFHTRCVWVEERLAKYIMDKYPDIYLVRGEIKGIIDEVQEQEQEEEEIAAELETVAAQTETIPPTEIKPEVKDDKKRNSKGNNKKSRRSNRSRVRK